VAAAKSMEVIEKVTFATFESMFDLLVIVISKKAVFHHMSLAIEKSIVHESQKLTTPQIRSFMPNSGKKSLPGR
jgi:hypothetical protein